MANFRRIDTHSHFLPDFLRDAMQRGGHAKPDGIHEIPPWNENDHIAFMDAAGISKSFLSISSPSVHFGNGIEARDLARKVNQEAASISKRNPDRFGSFASLPLPDVDGALAEVDYALDVLYADGFTLLTNYHGKYLGDEAFDPVFEKLNRRNAKIFIHPTSPCQTCGGKPQVFKPLDYPAPMMEFFFDTSRAVTNLILTGTISKFKNLTFLIPHCGAVLPSIIDRFSGFSAILKLGENQKAMTEEIYRIFRDRFYYDLVGFAAPNQIHGLLRFANHKRLLYGSDYPFTPVYAVKFLGEGLEKELEGMWDEQTLRDVFERNAEKLFEAEIIGND